jgi:phosphatidylglycerophosphate synthase
MLARWIRTWDSKILRPFLIFIARCGITPNILTISGLMTIVVSGFILARGYVVSGGCVFFFGALLDGIDGELARVLSSETRFGAFLNSISDHCGDFAVYLGLFQLSLKRNLTANEILIFVALFGSVFGSQVRSRAGMLGIDTKDVGLFTRFERTLVLILGLFTGKITAALWILALFNNFSAIQRITHVVSMMSLAEQHQEKPHGVK